MGARTFNFSFPLALAIALAGCRATMVATHGISQSEYAPLNEKESVGGTIKYLNQGAQSVRRRRRENAYKQMHDFCNGDYNIVAEGPRDQGGYAVPIGN